MSAEYDYEVEFIVIEETITYEEIIPFKPIPVFGSALCAQTDPEMFFPEKGQSSGVRAAKALCRRCDHEVPCREYAINDTTIKYGIWGATTARERGMMRRLLGIADGEEG